MYITPKPLKADEIIAGCIAVYRNVWDNPAETIKQIEEVTSDPSSGVSFEKAIARDHKTSELVEGKRTNSHLGVNEAGEINEVFRSINNRYYDLMASALKWYIKEFELDSGVYIKEPFALLRYQTGEEYKSHYDGGTATKRSVSPILYLNDDYTGGEIEFVNYGVKIKPEPGMFLLFPSSYPYAHIAHPVKTGTKYAIVTWVHDQQ